MKMRVLICSLVLLFTQFTGFNVYGQTVEKSRNVTEVFKVADDTEIEIINKYGNIHIIPWEKDSVKFEIELLVKGTKQSKVDKSFDYIEFDFKTSKYYIVAQTLFAGKSSFWSDVSDLTGAIFNSSTKTKIDYTVYLPEDVSLKVFNKYGNIYTTDHTGKVEINLSNGDLKAHHFSGPTKITHEFGNANIKQIDNGDLLISYGEFHLDNGGEINIESKSSKFYIDEVQEIELKSRRDKFYIDVADKLDGATNFSLIELEQLNSKFNLTTKYGDIDVLSFSDEVESFAIWSNDTDLTLHFTDAKQYKLDITVNDRTEVMYSADIKNISSKEIEGEEELIKVDCIIGSNEELIIPLKINSRAGSLSLKLK